MPLKTGTGTLPDLSRLGPQETRRKLTAVVLDLLENPDLYAATNYQFSLEWFDAAERFFQPVLNTQKIETSRRRTPVKAKSAESQNRIVRAILDHVEIAKAAIASATPYRVMNRSVGDLVWVGSDGRGGCGIRQKAKTLSYEVDFALAIRGALHCSGILSIWDGPKLIYETSATHDLNTTIGIGLDLHGGGTVTFYDGNEEQQPPAAIEAFTGFGKTSAYRGHFLAVFTNFPRATRSDERETDR